MLFRSETLHMSPYWMAVLAYLIPTFPLGYVWHLKTFKKVYDDLAMYRDDVIIPLGLASMLLQALLFAHVYPRLFNTAPEEWKASAMQFGAIFGALAWSFAVLPVAAKYRMTAVRRFLALETAFTGLQFLIVSPLIALAWRTR